MLEEGPWKVLVKRSMASNIHQYRNIWDLPYQNLQWSPVHQLYPRLHLRELSLRPEGLRNLAAVCVDISGVMPLMSRPKIRVEHRAAALAGE